LATGNVTPFADAPSRPPGTGQECQLLISLLTLDWFVGLSVLIDRDVRAMRDV